MIHLREGYFDGGIQECFLCMFLFDNDQNVYNQNSGIPFICAKLE